MKVKDIINFAYETIDDTVYIHCNVRGSTFEVAENAVPDDHVMYSWSVPAKEIENLEDPTDYLKQAIAEANQ